jgi:hypothetical protein
VGLELGGVAPALRSMGREGAVLPYTAEAHALGVQHRQGGVEASDALVVHVGCSFVVGAGQIRGLVGDMAAVHR